MAKIIDYKHVVGNNPASHESNMADMIADGWQPYGEPRIGEGMCPRIYQTVVKYEEPQTPVYDIMKADTVAALRERVTSALAQGWKLHGSLVRCSGAIVQPLKKGG